MFTGPNRESKHSMADIRWLAAVNDSGEELPACAAVVVDSSGDQGQFTVSKPTTDGEHVWIAGPIGALDGDQASVTNDFPTLAYYDDADGTPAVGETWGAGAGSWKLRKNKAGFRVCGTPDTDLKLVQVERASSDSSVGGSDIVYTCEKAQGAIIARNYWNLSFISKAGSCSSFDLTQTSVLSGAALPLTGDTDITATAGDYTPELTIITTPGEPRPRFRFLATGTNPDVVWTFRRCGVASSGCPYIEFFTSDPDICADPITGCTENSLIARLECCGPPNANWFGYGWYCIEGDSASLLPTQIDANLVNIISGPFATEGEVVCVVNDCECEESGAWNALFELVSGADDLQIDGETFRLTYNPATSLFAYILDSLNIGGSGADTVWSVGSLSLAKCGREWILSGRSYPVGIGYDWTASGCGSGASSTTPCDEDRVSVAPNHFTPVKALGTALTGVYRVTLTPVM